MRSLKLILIASALAFTAPTLALAQNTESATNSAATEASIPFANFGTIRDWRPDGKDGLYIQGTGDQWYYATLMSPCTGLNFTDSIGFDTKGGANALDRFSAIVVDGQQCQFKSLVKSDPPKIEPKKRK